MSESSFTLSSKSENFDNIIEFSNDSISRINVPNFSKNSASVINFAIKFSDDSILSYMLSVHISRYFDDSTTHNV